MHFSVLQEYIAARTGARLGRLYQLSNNYHVYTSILPRLDGLTQRRAYENLEVTRTPLVASGAFVKMFDIDLALFMRHGGTATDWLTPFFAETVCPMHRAHTLFSRGERQAAREMLSGGTDWITAGREWIERRL